MLSMHLFVHTLLVHLIVVPLPPLAYPPSEVRAAVAEMNPSPISPPPVATSQRTLPEAPARQKVIDHKFIGVMAALGGAETLRFTTHKMVLDREYDAGAPWITSVPSGPHMFAKYGGIFAGELAVAYELKKPHDWLPGDKVVRKLWWAPPAVLAIIHTKNGIRSMRTHGPGGYTSVVE